MRGADLLVVLATGWIAYRIYLGSWAVPDRYAWAFVLAMVLVALSFKVAGLYEAWRGRSLLDEIHALTFAWGGVFAILLVLAVITKTGAYYSRLWGGLWFLLGWFGLVTGRIALRATLKELRKRGFNQRNMLLIGNGEILRTIISNLRAAPWSGLNVSGILTDERVESIEDVPVYGKPSDVGPYVSNGGVDQVWIALPLREEDRVRELLHELRHSTADIRYVPDLFGFRLLNHSITDIAGLPVMNLSVSPMDGPSRVLKEIEDRVLAAFILAAVFPLMVLIALCIKLDSPGPVLFKQRRHGWDGRIIKVYKFRTMHVHQEPEGCVTQARKNDDRVTRCGAFLRRTSLDELPQFFNVLQGRMSIVGPRPHAVEHNEQYKELIDQYMLRHKVKPGITGWAQVNGYRGETDTLEKMKKRVEYDLFYIENWSLWFDIKIILLTLFKGFYHRNAY